MKRPAWLKKGARVVLPCKVESVADDIVRVRTPLGLILGLTSANLGKTWHRAPAKKARKR